MPVNPDEIDRLHDKWLAISQDAFDKELELANAIADDKFSPSQRAALEMIVRTQHNNAQRTWSEYQDLVSRLHQEQTRAQTEQAYLLARTNTTLARAQACLAAVITLASLAQVVLAVVK